jgi:hypothetical protein
MMPAFSPLASEPLLDLARQIGVDFWAEDSLQANKASAHCELVQR